MEKFENVCWNKNELKAINVKDRFVVEGATKNYFKKSLEALKCIAGLIPEDEECAYLEVFMNGYAEQERTEKDKIIVGYNVREVDHVVYITILVMRKISEEE